MSQSTLTLRTTLHRIHQKHHAKLIDFFGWSMPLHYGSQIEEHLAVRQHAGLFDVSHMGVLDVQGTQAQAFLRHLLANDIQKLGTANKALYSCMLNEHGGVMDDLIVYRMNNQHYRLIINASNREKDVNWLLQQQANFPQCQCQLQPALSILAIQGPKAIGLLSQMLNTDLNQCDRFHFITKGNLFIARTGYTGEDGVEVILPNDQAELFWQQCINAGIQPCGLGARDSLRLEAGYNLYGQDMDEQVHPYAANLSWTLCWKDPQRDFIGKTALQTIALSKKLPQFTGVVLLEPGVLRNQQIIQSESGPAGIITSGGYSPTLKMAIGFARLSAETKQHRLFIERRGKKIPLKKVATPFVKKNQINF